VLLEGSRLLVQDLSDSAPQLLDLDRRGRQPHGVKQILLLKL
jgi:hypothetical protein